MQDILAIIPHGNVKAELVNFFSQYQKYFFPIFPVCIPIFNTNSSLKSLKPLFSNCKITLENLQITNISAFETALGFGGENPQENCNNTKIAALSVDCPNFQNIPFLKDKKLFLPLGFLKKSSNIEELKSDFKIDFKIFQLAHIRINKKSPKSTNEPTLSFSYTILDSIWCK